MKSSSAVRLMVKTLYFQNAPKTADGHARKEVYRPEARLQGTFWSTPPQRCAVQMDCVSWNGASLRNFGVYLL
jgi:hypothetical protein